jgi:hypothetical protein
LQCRMREGLIQARCTRVAADLIEFGVEQTPEGDETTLTLTPDGYEALERWDFGFEAQEEEAAYLEGS